MGRRYLLRKKIFCILFLLVMFAYSGVNAYFAYNDWYGVWKANDIRKNPARLVSEMDGTITSGMLGRMEFIETYSYVQALLGKREFNNFTSIKDENGFLHYASFFREDDPDMFEYAKRVKRLQDYAEQYGTKVIFLVTAGKYTEGTTKFATGMPVNNPNDRVNELLFYLNRLQVKTIDCRKYIPNADVPYEEAFFRTDHHWTVPAAFEAAKVLTASIKEFYGEDLDPFDYYLNRKNYEIITYEHGMCGSMGRKTGGNFVGLEDFTAYWPKFHLNCSREYLEESGRMAHLKGDISEVVIDGTALTKGKDIYSASQYALYLNELRTYDKVVNLDYPNRPSMLAIRDSYFSPVIAFMLPMFSQIDSIWTLEKTDKIDIEQYVKEHRFDYIVIEVYPYNINNDAFNFFKEVS